MTEIYTYAEFKHKYSGWNNNYFKVKVEYRGRFESIGWGNFICIL